MMFRKKHRRSFADESISEYWRRTLPKNYSFHNANDAADGLELSNRTWVLLFALAAIVSVLLFTFKD